MALRGYKPKQKKALWFRAQGLPEKPKRVIRVRPVSKARSASLRQYRKVKDAFLALKENWTCAACKARKVPHQYRQATEIHHKRGRTGVLLTDTRFFLGVCSDCHHWIHHNIKLARTLNLIAQPGEWGKQE